MGELILIQWTYILQMWEARNKAVQKKYIDKGQSREIEFLQAKAIQNMEDFYEEDDSDADGFQKKPEEVETMNKTSLQIFVKSVKN